MRNNISTIFLFFIMIVLFVGFVILGGAIYLDLFSETTTPAVFEIDEIATEEPAEKRKETVKTYNTGLSDSLISSSVDTSKDNNNMERKSENVNNHFFYNQLNSTQKKIYDGLNNNKGNLKQGNFTIKYGDAFSSILVEENGSTILGNDYQTAVEAFTHDNPDLFYLDVNKMYLNIETTTKFLKTTYNVFIAPKQGENYLLDDFTSQEEIEDGIIITEEIKEKILNKLSNNDYRNITLIHDYLVTSIDYDTTYDAKGTYTLYGALIGKKCVCEGYAKAFKYLANAAGYKAEIMQGKATNTSGQTENHAWNCIELNGIWYEVDTTWDDPIIIGGNGKISNQMKYKYFLKGTSTFEKDHTLSYQFSSEGKSFLYPTISKNDY